MSGVTYLVTVLFSCGFDHELFFEFSHFPLPMISTVNDQAVEQSLLNSHAMTPSLLLKPIIENLTSYHQIENLAGHCSLLPDATQIS
jgi:hypothetical protein